MKIVAPPALVASPVSSVAGHSVELPCDARPSIQGDQVISTRPITTGNLPVTMGNLMVTYQVQSKAKHTRRPGNFYETNYHW